MKLWHVRGRLFCERCVLRCRTKAEKANAVTLDDVPGLECDRCARFGYPALTAKASAVIAETKPSGSRTEARERDGITYTFGSNADPVLQAYGYKKSDVIDAKRRLKQIGVDLSVDAVGSLLCREQTLRDA